MKYREFLFTAFYSGYSPVLPGTAGTLVAMAIYILEYAAFGNYSRIVNVLAVVFFSYPAIKLCGEGEKHFGVKDPPQVVIDEVFGYWISVLFYPFSMKIVVAAFFLFRLLDILKPYPISRLERISGGAGIFIDDCIAGLYTNIIIFIFIAILGSFDISMI